MLIQDYCQAAGRVSSSVSEAQALNHLPFNIFIHKLAGDPEDVLTRHAADVELSGTAKATDDSLRIHRYDLL